MCGPSAMDASRITAFTSCHPRKRVNCQRRRSRSSRCVRLGQGIEQIDRDRHLADHGRPLAFLQRTDRDETSLALDRLRGERESLGYSAPCVEKHQAEGSQVGSGTGKGRSKEPAALGSGQIFSLAGSRIETANATVVSEHSLPQSSRLPRRGRMQWFCLFC